MTERKVKVFACTGEEIVDPPEEALNALGDWPYGGTVTLSPDGTVFFVSPYIPLMISGSGPDDEPFFYTLFGLRPKSSLPRPEAT